MPFDRELLARSKMPREDAPEPHDPGAALREARAARAGGKPRAWTQTFFERAQHVGLSLAALNDIVAENDTLDAAMAAMAKRVAAGAGSPTLRKPAQVDAATRISAAHAKAHQPRRPPTRH